MCLILLSYEMHSKYRMVLAANRDEYYNRPTAPIGFHDDAPNVLGGQDLKHHGMWLGITRFGRFAAGFEVLDQLSAVFQDAFLIAVWVQFRHSLTLGSDPGVQTR